MPRRGNVWSVNMLNGIFSRSLLFDCKYSQPKNQESKTNYHTHTIENWSEGWTICTKYGNLI